MAQRTRAVARGLCAAAILFGAVAASAGEPQPGGTTLREPAFGLPHFVAHSDQALARENGREIAKDRLGQLILLGRVGRGTLSQVFGILDPSTLDDDVVARQTAYTSAELNDMFAKLPPNDAGVLLAYCDGINDTIEQVYAGALPEPVEVNLLRTLGVGADLFGNATNISDQVDPYYRAPGGADPQRPNGGYQFTPEMAVAIGILEVRNFGLESFDEPSRLSELQRLVAKHGESAGAQIWDDLNFLNDPLAPVTVPDSTTPGYGGPLARPGATRTTQLASARQQPRFDYAAAAERRREALARREAFASRWGAWPTMGSYAWAVAGNRSAGGYPWLGGFPQTGIQTPSIMHFAENRSAESIKAIGMEFAGGPFVLIGHTDTVAWTTTTALLRTVDTYFEQIIGEDADTLRYFDEGAPAPLSQRVEIFRGNPELHQVMWRSHARQGNGGSRPVIDFIGDTRGIASGGTATTLVADGAFDAGFAGGHIAIVAGTAAGAIRRIVGVGGDDTVGIDPSVPWPFVPGADSEFVAVRPGQGIVAVATESPLWKEETTAVLGFSRFQQAADAMNIRAAARIIPSTHNFLAADNQPFNGFGADNGNGNIGYWATGFSRIRKDGTDVRLPIDGSGPNPFVVASGRVASADLAGLTGEGAPFAGLTLAPPPVNFRYDNPTQVGREYIVTITTGAGAKQTRRIASNTAATLGLEYRWGTVPEAGDTFEVYAIAAMPEAVNPSEGYLANWNNKAATADEGNNFGRLWRHIFILERLATETAWDRTKQRQLNADVAGLDGRGDLGRFLLPRIRQAVDAVGSGGNAAVETVLARLEAHQAAPDHGRFFNDPVADTTAAGEATFLSTLINALSQEIYGDEFAGALGVPSGSRALSLVQHAIDSAAGDLPGGYQQAYDGDYFGGRDWRTVVRDVFAAHAAGGIPADAVRPQSRYAHPLSALLPELVFPPTPQGNRGTYEQIVEVGPLVRGEFIFPLGQSGFIAGSLEGVNSIDPNFTSLHPIWRDWRFVPMLPIGRDLAAGGSDTDSDLVPDAFERWYFDDLSGAGNSDADRDGLALVEEAALGVDPTAADTDGDGLRDGFDTAVRDRLADSRCVNDCDGDRAVTVDELLRAVSISLGDSEIAVCSVADRNGDGEISVDELIRGVNAALIDCEV
jgi:hypothetical protein